MRQLHSTVPAVNFGGDYVDRGLLTTVQNAERRRSQVETMAGSVDRGHIDPRVVLRVRDFPASAAVRRVPRDVPSATNVGVARDVAERRVFGGEAVGPVRARDVSDRVTGVVERAVERGAWGRRGRIRIPRDHGWLRQGMCNLREEEGEGEGDGADRFEHCECGGVGLCVW